MYVAFLGERRRVNYPRRDVLTLVYTKVKTLVNEHIERSYIQLADNLRVICLYKSLYFFFVFGFVVIHISGVTQERYYMFLFSVRWVTSIYYVCLLVCYHPK